MLLGLVLVKMAVFVAVKSRQKQRKIARNLASEICGLFKYLFFILNQRVKDKIYL